MATGNTAIPVFLILAGSLCATPILCIYQKLKGDYWPVRHQTFPYMSGGKRTPTLPQFEASQNVLGRPLTPSSRDAIAASYVQRPRHGAPKLSYPPKVRVRKIETQPSIRSLRAEIEEAEPCPRLHHSNKVSPVQEPPLTHSAPSRTRSNSRLKRKEGNACLQETYYDHGQRVTLEREFRRVPL